MNIPSRSDRRLHFLCASLFLCCVIQAAPSPLISQLGLPDGVKMRIGRGSVHSVDYSPDGRRIAAASSVGIWIYDALFGGEIALLGAHESWVNSAAYSPDGKRIVSAGNDMNGPHLGRRTQARFSKRSKGINISSYQRRIHRTANESSAQVRTRQRASGTPTQARFSKLSKDIRRRSRLPRFPQTENRSSARAGTTRSASGTPIQARRSTRSKGIQ